MCSLRHNGHKIKLHVWDTTGHERFRAITTSYYRVAHACVVVYDATSAHSFAGVADWLAAVRTFASDGVTVAILGTKCDLGGQRQVTSEAAMMLAAQHGVMHLNATAAAPELVASAFEEIAGAILRRQAELAAQRREAQLMGRVVQWASLPSLPCRDAAAICCLPSAFTSLFSCGAGWAPVASSS